MIIMILLWLLWNKNIEQNKNNKDLFFILL